LEDSTHKTDLELLLKVAHTLGDDIREMEAIDSSIAYEKTCKKINANKGKQLRNRMLRYAAFLTLPLFVSSLVLGYLYFLNESEPGERYAEVTAASGSVIRYELPDRSVVWLNAGSTLRYPTVFHNDNRKVDLKGEAYFEVEADKKRPFYVNTPSGLSVFVYGTKFNVSAYEDENSVETVLEQGKVNVIMPDKKSIIKLKVGEQLIYDKIHNKVYKNGVDVYEKTAWKDGKLIFRNASLKDILRRLERHFNVDIDFNNPSGKEYNYRATFRYETLPQILDYLAKSAALKWRPETPVQQPDESYSKQKIIVDLY